MKQSSIKRFIRSNLSEVGVFALLVVLFISTALASNKFLTYQNISSICSTLAYYGVIVCGAAVVMIMGGLDLSQMATMAMGVVIGGQILLSGIPGAPFYAMIVQVAVGAVFGLINGLIVSYLNIPPMITTIGTQYIFRAIAFIVVGSKSFWINDSVYKIIGYSSFLGLPLVLWVMLMVFCAMWGVMRFTQFGQNIYAIGSNEQAARLAGINVTKSKILAYTLSGTLAGLAGILWMAQLSASRPSAGQGQEMIVLAAVVIGGVSLNGGKGKIPGVLFGIGLLMLLANSMTLLHLNTYLQELFQGIILIIAVIAGTKRGKQQLDI